MSELSVRALGYSRKLFPGDVQLVSLLSSDENISWEQKEDALLVQFPETKPCEYAYCL